MGVVLAWSLVHGGPGGNFFSPTLYHAIAYGVDVTKPDLNDIHDDQLSESLSKVKLCCITTILIHLCKVPLTILLISVFCDLLCPAVDESSV